MTRVIPLVLGLALSAHGATGFNGPTAPKTGRIRVAFTLTEGATVMDFGGPWEVFQDVMIEGRGSGDDQMPFELYTVGDSTAPITGSGGLKLVPDYTFDNAPAPKVVVVGAQRGSPKLTAWLQKVAADPRTDIVMSVCTGAFKLAGAGLLNGKAATTHHDFFESFQERFPKVQLQKGMRFVESDSRTMTSGGLTSGIDLALHVVALYFGDTVAEKTVAYMEYQSNGWRHGTAAPSSR
jgi:transcriptional regulator GlxA family with amidase domain